MREEYINALSNDSSKPGMLCRIASFFTRQADTVYGMGDYYIVDLFGAGAAKIISIVCENHSIPVMNLRDIQTKNDTIRDTVEYIMEHSPPRCAIILDTRDHPFVQKVRTRISHTHCDLRFRRVIFCLTAQETGSANCIQVPGSIDDKMEILMYHIPDCIRQQVTSPDCFRPLAEAMMDYDLFEPHVWKHVSVDGTLKDFLSTALYQIVRRVRSDPDVEDGSYPLFELDWRRSLAPLLRGNLPITPDALCPSIHRVIPVGVLPSDAIQAMEFAIPKNIQNPYAITVQSTAVDDKCGKIAISQPMQYTVVNVHCEINPGVLVDVCRELRSGHRAVAAEVHSVRRELSIMKSVMEEKHEEMKSVMQKEEERSTQSNNQLRQQLSDIQHEMTTLVTRLTGNNDCIACPGDGLISCSKPGCNRVVIKRFRSGKAPRQCSIHLGYAHGSKKRSLSVMDTQKSSMLGMTI
jgi:hypothetical protein